MAAQVDFYGMLSGIGNQIQTQRKEAARRAAFEDINNPDGTVDFNKAIMGLTQAGDIEGAARISQLKNAAEDRVRQARQDDYQRQRDTVSDTRADRQFGATQAYQKEQLDLSKRSADRADERAEVPAGFERNPAGGIRPIKGGPQDPGYLKTVPGAESKDLASVIEQRKTAAASIGLTPDHPAYNAFVLTNKMPREDAQPLTAGDKEAIRAADDAVVSNKAAIDSLKRATKLSEQAFTGPAAGVRGYAASFLGEGSDTGKAGIATENLTNEVMTNALGQLKAIFGGNPTEGERRILLDLQGSANKPHVVRKAIFDRAIAAAQVRLDANQKRADELRGNTYYKPGNGPAVAPATAAAPAAPGAPVDYRTYFGN